MTTWADFAPPPRPLSSEDQRSAVRAAFKHLADCDEMLDDGSR